MAVSNLKTYKNVVNQALKLTQAKMESTYCRGGNYKLGKAYVKYFGIWQYFPMKLKANFKLVAWEEKGGKVYIGLPYNSIFIEGQPLDDEYLISKAYDMVKESVDYPSSYKKYVDMLSTNGFNPSWCAAGTQHLDDFRKTEFYKEYKKNLNVVSGFELVWECPIWSKNKVTREDVLPIAFFDFDENLYYWFKNGWPDNSNITSFRKDSIFIKGKPNLADFGWRCVQKTPWNTLKYSPKSKDEDIYIGSDNSFYIG